MKEVQLPLRTAYLSALSGLVVNSISIPVYDEFAPAGAPDHFIVISNQTDSEIGNKQAFYSDCSITVDITTRFKPNLGGKELSERIAEAVLQIIKPANRNQLTVTGFQVVSTKKQFAQNLSEDLPTIRVFRKVITFTHRIVEI